MACVNCGKSIEAGNYICEKCTEDAISQHRIGSSLAMCSSAQSDIFFNTSTILDVEQAMSPESLNLFSSEAEKRPYPEEFFDIDKATADRGEWLLKGYVRMLKNIDLPFDLEEKSLPIFTDKDLSIAEKVLKGAEVLENKFPDFFDIDLYILLGSLHYSLGFSGSGVITIADEEYHINKAEEFYDKALSIDTNSLPARKNKAKLLLKIGEYEDALESLNWILSNLKPPGDDLSVVLNKGIALLELDRLDEASECFDGVLDRNPTNAEAWFRKGNILRNTDRWGGAIQCFNEAIKHDLKREDIRIAMVELYIANGKYKDATDRLSEVLKMNISDPYAWYLQGIVFSKIGRWGAAVQCFNTALTINPYHVKSWKAKGDLLAGGNRYDEALDCYENALKHRPDSFTLLNSKIKILKATRKYDEALHTLEKVLEVDEDNADAWFEIGNILEETGKVYKALKGFDKALELRPSFPEAYYKKGLALEKLRRYKEAINCYEKALELDPKFVKALTAKKDCLGKINES